MTTFSPSPAVNPDEFDPGIRATVLWLRVNSFNTTDSGDGVTKLSSLTPEEQAECGVLDVPHVHMSVDATDVISQAHRLADLLFDAGIVVQCDVQVTYSPFDQVATLSLYGVDDARLNAALRRPVT